MRTRKSASTSDSKATPPARKPAARTQKKTPDSTAADSDTPKTRRGRGRPQKNPQPLSVEGADVEEDKQQLEDTPPVKPASAGKRTGAAKSKTPASGRGTRRSSRLLEADELNVEEAGEVNVEEASQKEDVVESNDDGAGVEVGVQSVEEVVKEEAVAVIDQGDGHARIEESVDEKGGETVGHSSGDITEGFGKEKGDGSGVDELAHEVVEESEKREAETVLGVCTTVNAGLSMKQQSDKDEFAQENELLPPRNADKKDKTEVVVEVPSIIDADFSLKHHEEPDKNEESTMPVGVAHIASAEDSLKQEEPDKNEEVAMTIELPPISKAGIALTQQEEPCRKEETAVAMEVPPTTNAEVSLKQQVESCKKEETVVDMEVPSVPNAEVLLKQQEVDKEGTAMEMEVPPVVPADVSSKHEEHDKKEKSLVEIEEPFVVNADISLMGAELSEGVSLKEGKTPEVFLSAKSEEPRTVKDDEEVKRKQILGVTEIDKKEAVSLTVDVAGSSKSERLSDPHKTANQSFDDTMEEHGDQVNLEQHEEDDPVEPVEETATLEEHRDLTAAVKDRMTKKDCEIFVGGLERDATEDDLRKAFDRIGEVTEVRLHKNLSTNKNKGYAFVRFANKDLAKRALEEMKNPVICGKQCGTAPCEDNNTLFLGNICNTWTREAIRQKLKEYGIEGVESINLVQDVQHEGLSRGFAFLEFTSHSDALLAYRRLQKPDVVFGHPERTAKVAFAEPLREPDPEVMAQVKTVFLDGLPIHWDENHIREQLKSYGEILRVVLARNMSNAKRKDYGFVDFSTHDAAVSCINGVDNTELEDGNKKTKVKARLSNPLPKTQAVKGEICGGYLIGRGSGSVSKSGRNYGRDMAQFNRASVQRGRGFHQGGHGRFGRAGFPIADEYNNPYEFHGRQMPGRGGRRGSYRGGHAMGIGPSIATSARPSPVRPWHAAPDIGRGRHIPPPRQPYSSEGGFARPFGNNFDDPYLYDDNARGMKRPLYMTEIRPDYMEPSSVRPRIEYSDPAAPQYGNRYPDPAGPSGGLYPRDYYGSNSNFRGGSGGGAGRGRFPSYYGEARPYNGGYY